MKRTPTSPITIGRDPILSHAVTAAIHNRKVREIRDARIRARRKEKILQFRNNVLAMLRFWK